MSLLTFDAMIIFLSGFVTCAAGVFIIVLFDVAMDRVEELIDRFF